MPRIVLSAIAMAGCLLSCSQDLTLPYPPRIIGEYEGLYQYQELADTSANSDELSFMTNDSQFVRVTIDSQYLRMTMDTRKTPANNRVACDVRANYRLDGTITLWYPDERIDPHSDPAKTCSWDRAPAGTFTVHQHGDSLILKREQAVSANGHRIAIRWIMRLTGL